MLRLEPVSRGLLGQSEISPAHPFDPPTSLSGPNEPPLDGESSYSRSDRSVSDEIVQAVDRCQVDEGRKWTSRVEGVAVRVLEEFSSA
jgi:hypothetical protein